MNQVEVLNSLNDFVVTCFEPSINMMVKEHVQMYLSVELYMLLW